MPANDNRETYNNLRKRFQKLEEENRKLRDELAVLKAESDEIIRGLKFQKLQAPTLRPNIYRQPPPNPKG